MSEEKNSEVETTSKPGLKNSKKSRILRLAIPIILIAAICFAVPWYRYKISHETTDDAFIDGRIVQVSPRVPGHVIAVYVKDNQWVEKGDLLVELDPADYKVQLDSAKAELKSARVSNQVKGLDVDLSEIASRSGLDDAKANVGAARARVDAAEAQINAAASQLKEIRARVKIARIGLDLAKAEAAAARAEHDRNRTDLKRYRQMAKRSMIPEQKVDHMAASEKMSAARLEAAEKKIKAKETSIRQYEAALDTAKDRLSEAKARVRASRAQLVQANAGVQAARAGPKQVDQSRSMTEMAKAQQQKAVAGVEQARLNLSYTKIVAESSGFVSNKSVEPGMFVQVGQPLLALVSDDVWVKANFKETQLTHMQTGQPVKIRVDTYPDAVFKGRVDSVQHGTGSRFSLLPAQNATGNFVKVVQRIPVKIVFEPDRQLDEYTLAPGMSVIPEVDITKDSSDNADLASKAFDSMADPDGLQARPAK